MQNTQKTNYYMHLINTLNKQWFFWNQTTMQCGTKPNVSQIRILYFLCYIITN